ncbi:class II fructose-bisphosphate aldolase, partial [Arthrobacter deserti]|nr:class II fructose-bisphosphate aldolase [Arthrobacter deserti]
AARYGVTIALHTDHCGAANLGDWVRPLLHHSAGRVRAGLDPLIQSHMWDGSALDLARNLNIARELLELSGRARTLLEIEVGVVGGADHAAGEVDEKLYSTVEDARAIVAALGAGERGRYLTALTFGNVHGAYKPGAVRLRPEILRDIQQQVGAELGVDRPFDLVFHGGSGSTEEEIAQAVEYG